jgi:hypothetical protein
MHSDLPVAVTFLAAAHHRRLGPGGRGRGPAAAAAVTIAASAAAGGGGGGPYNLKSRY